MKKLNLIIILFTVIFGVQAENMSVESFSLLTNDLTATIQGTKRYDPNTRKDAALVKIETSYTGFVFEPGSIGLVGDPEYKTGEIWLYIPEGSKKLTIKHASLGILRDYYYPIVIQSGKTYLMKLSTGKVISHVEQDLGGNYLSLTIEPKNAEVYIDGRTLQTDAEGGISTFLQYGTYQYEISSYMYKKEIGNLTISSNAVTEKNVKLEPDYSILQINSNPSGARVYIDDVDAGTTPLTTKKVIAGEHKFEFRLPMYSTKTVTHQVLSSGTTQEITETLQPNFSSVTIIAPNNAEIYVNNEKKGVGSWSGNLNTGDYVVEARKESHHSSKTTISVKAGVNINKTLEAPTPRYGILNIQTNPSKAEIFVDGENIGVTPGIFKNILIGNREITVKRDGYATITKTISVEEGKVSQENIAMQNSGELVITSSVSGAEVYINNKYVGTAPYTCNLESGIYDVTLKANGYVDTKEIAQVTAGQKTNLNIKLNTIYGNAKIYSNVLANVYISGKKVGETPYDYNAPSGIYEVTLSKNGYKSKTKDIEVVPGIDIVENIYLTKKHSIKELLSAAINLNCIFGNNSWFGANVMFKIGQERLTWLTFCIGLGIDVNFNSDQNLDLVVPNYDSSSSNKSPEMIDRVPIISSLRLRLAGGEKANKKWALYMGPRYTMNFNTGFKSEKSLVNNYNQSIGGEVGIAYSYLDFSVSCMYDIDSLYDQVYIYNTYRNYYNSNVSRINGRWAVGLSLGVNFPFSK